MQLQTALMQTAKKIGVPISWLDSLIRFESNWKPDAKNKFTGARGLIQFMPGTAKALGFKDAEDLFKKYPDAVSQLLGPVTAYFNLPGNRGPYPTPQSLYMTVFYPVARKWPPETVFPDTVRKVNPGIVRVSDYVAKVERRKILVDSTPIIFTALIIGGYLIYKTSKKGVSKWTAGRPQVYLGT